LVGGETRKAHLPRPWASKHRLSNPRGSDPGGAESRWPERPYSGEDAIAPGFEIVYGGREPTFQRPSSARQAPADHSGGCSPEANWGRLSCPPSGGGGPLAGKAASNGPQVLGNRSSSSLKPAWLPLLCLGGLKSAQQPSGRHSSASQRPAVLDGRLLRSHRASSRPDTLAGPAMRLPIGAQRSSFPAGELSGPRWGRSSPKTRGCCRCRPCSARVAPAASPSTGPGSARIHGSGPDRFPAWRRRRRPWPERNSKLSAGRLPGIAVAVRIRGHRRAPEAPRLAQERRPEVAALTQRARTQPLRRLCKAAEQGCGPAQQLGRQVVRARRRARPRARGLAGKAGLPE